MHQIIKFKCGDQIQSILVLLLRKTCVTEAGVWIQTCLLLCLFLPFSFSLLLAVDRKLPIKLARLGQNQVRTRILLCKRLDIFGWDKRLRFQVQGNFDLRLISRLLVCRILLGLGVVWVRLELKLVLPGVWLPSLCLWVVVCQITVLSNKLEDSLLLLLSLNKV